MDPVSMTASVIALLQLTGVAIGYLNDVKSAPKDRADCAIQATNLLGLLTSLRYRLEDSNATDPWFIAVRALAAEGGPMDQFKEALDQLVEKLKPKTGWKHVSEGLTWSLTKKDVESILSKLERLKLNIQMALDNDHFKLSQEIKRDTQATHEIVAALESDKRDGDRESILAWLSTEDYAAQQLNFSRAREPGTGQWFLNSSEFQEWLNTPKQILFCPGHPGTGKTMLASLVIDHLTTTQTVDRLEKAYVYFNYKRQQQQDVSSVLSSLLKQLIQDQFPLPKAVVKLYETYGSKLARPSVDELSKALSLVIQPYGRTLIVLDALDECDMSTATCKTVLAKLRTLQSNNDVRILATSRFISDIEQQFAGNSKRQIRASDTDVEAYLNTHITLLPHYSKYSHLHSTIEERILDSVDGMFLLARLYLAALRSKRTAGAVKSALVNLSKSSNTLEEAYDDAITRIDAQSDDDTLLARRIFSWISLSQVELTTLELQHALAIEPDAEEFDEDSILQPEDILSVCAGLVSINEENDVVGFVHYTTQEYLKHKLASWNPGAQAYLALTCLGYLKRLSLAYPTDRENQYPFSMHALRYWGDYVNPLQDDKLVRDAAVALCSCTLIEESVQSTIFELEYPYSPGMLIKLYETPWAALHILAFFGLEKVMIQFLEGNPTYDLNRLVDHESPLSIAAALGHLNVVIYLTSRDDVDLNRSLQTPLHEAAEAGHVKVVEVFLNHPDINPNIVNPSGRTPLHLAVLSEQLDVVEALILRTGVDVNAVDGQGVTPLILASRRAGNGRMTNFIDLLLQRQDLNINVTSKQGYTALTEAATHDAEGLTKLLLGRSDVDVDIKTANGSTVFHIAATRGLVATMEVLLQRSCPPINTIDRHGCTPLIYAVRFDREYIAELLLERDDVDVNATNTLGTSALIFAARFGRSNMVKLLLERDDIDVNLETSAGRSALSEAAEEGESTIVEMLLARPEIDVSALDRDDHSPLWYASRWNHKDVVELLLERGDVDPTNMFDQDADSFAIDSASDKDSNEESEAIERGESGKSELDKVDAAEELVTTLELVGS